MDVTKSQFPVTWGFTFPSMLQRVCSISYHSVLKPKRSGGTAVKCSRWDDKSLCVKLVVVSLLKHNSNQQISHLRSFTSTRKVNIDESFGSSTFKLDTAKRQVVGLFIIAILLKFYLTPRVQVKIAWCHFFRWPTPGLKKQSWCWK